MKSSLTYNILSFKLTHNKLMQREMNERDKPWYISAPWEDGLENE